MAMTVSSYRDLDVWNRAMDFVVACYRLTDKFPKREEFGLTAQLRRAAISVPTNIAEGHGRSSTGDYLRHLSIAHGSLMELETQLEIGRRLGYLDEPACGHASSEALEIGRMLHGLIRSLKTGVNEA